MFKFLDETELMLYHQQHVDKLYEKNFSLKKYYCIFILSLYFKNY